MHAMRNRVSPPVVVARYERSGHVYLITARGERRVRHADLLACYERFVNAGTGFNWAYASQMHSSHDLEKTR